MRYAEAVRFFVAKGPTRPVKSEPRRATLERVLDRLGTLRHDLEARSQQEAIHAERVAAIRGNITFEFTVPQFAASIRAIAGAKKYELSSEA